MVVAINLRTSRALLLLLDRKSRVVNPSRVVQLTLPPRRHRPSSGCRKLPTHLLGTFRANRDRALHAALARTHGPPLAADTRRLRFATTRRTLKHRQYHGLQYEQGNLALNTVYLDVPLLPLHPTFMPRLLHWLEHWLGLMLVHGEITVPPTASTHLDEPAQLREAVLFMETLPGPLIEKARCPCRRPACKGGLCRLRRRPPRWHAA